MNLGNDKKRGREGERVLDPFILLQVIIVERESDREKGRERKREKKSDRERERERKREKK